MFFYFGCADVFCFEKRHIGSSPAAARRTHAASCRRSRSNHSGKGSEVKGGMSSSAKGGIRSRVSVVWCELEW